MSRFTFRSALAVAALAGTLSQSARAAGAPAGMAETRVSARACLAPFQEVPADGGRLVTGWCRGLLGVFDFGNERVPATGASTATFVRATTSPASADDVNRAGAASFEVTVTSSAPRIEFGAPAVDGSLIASPSILPGARYQVIISTTGLFASGAGAHVLARSRVYVAAMRGVLRVESPLAGLRITLPAQLHVELVRTFAPAAPPASAPLASPQAASKYLTLHHFTEKPDGQLEWGSLLLGAGGILYGTATAGGSYGFGRVGNTVSEGYGTIFEVVPPAKGLTTYTTRVLHSFTGGIDGKFPYGSLIGDKVGNLYGITTGDFDYQGSVFKFSPPAKGKTEWTLTPLHIFTGKADGGSPYGDLTIDRAGNLYGTTYYGGKGCNTAGCGVVFELSPPAKGQTKWTERVLFAFDDGVDGGNPNGGLARRADGVLFGMTSLGGNPNAFAGTVFALAPPAKGQSFWHFFLLHTFSGLTDGGMPNAAPILDSKGAVYGTTVLGGSFFEGTVFKLTPPSGASRAWGETVLHDFGEGKDGVIPHGTLVFDKAGALYGTALAGGAAGLGTAFKLTPPAAGQHTWLETELDGFAGGVFGDGPNAALIFDSAGAIYGTTSGSRLDDYGTVFKLIQ